jgi:hypothetical protein
VEFFTHESDRPKIDGGIDIDMDQVPEGFTRSEGVEFDGRKLISIDFGFEYTGDEDFDKVVDGREVTVRWNDGEEIFRAKNPAMWDGQHHYPTVQWDGADRQISETEAYVELELVSEREMSESTD